MEISKVGKEVKKLCLKDETRDDDGDWYILSFSGCSNGGDVKWVPRHKTIDVEISKVGKEVKKLCLKDETR